MFVVEGIAEQVPIDYVTLWQWGYQVVAKLGTSIKAQDAHGLARTVKVMIVPDNGEAGEAVAARRWEALERDLMFHLPLGMEGVDDLAQRVDREVTFHWLAQALLSDSCEG